MKKVDGTALSPRQYIGGTIFMSGRECAILAVSEEHFLVDVGKGRGHNATAAHLVEYLAYDYSKLPLKNANGYYVPRESYTVTLKGKPAAEIDREESQHMFSFDDL